MSDPLVHLVVTVVADQEGTAMKGEVVVFVGTEQMHREALDLAGGPYELQRAALSLHELGLEALDVATATQADEAPPPQPKKRSGTQREPKRRKEQAPARRAAAPVDQGSQRVRVSSSPRSRRR